MCNLTIIISSNAKGICSMTDGDHASAMTSFRQALGMTRSMLPMAATAAIAKPSAWALDTISCAPVVDMMTNFALFNRCFTLLPTQQNFGSATNRDAELLTGMILYNMALACQKEAYHDRRYFNKAFRIYQTAAQVLQNSHHTNTDIAALLLAISNNLASIALENFDYESFTMYREWMGSLLFANQEFHPSLFSLNFATTYSACERPAPAA